jgi:glycosyltransferase involved in cell wall biosynthesis
LRVLLLARDERSVMSRRARALAAHAGPDVEVDVAYRPLSLHEARALIGRVLEARVDAVYVFDTNPLELGPAALRRLTGTPFVLEVGDAVGAYLRASGAPRAKVAWRSASERAGWRFADSLVVRGEGFRDVLSGLGVARSVHVLPDGVDLERFRPDVPTTFRQRTGLPADALAVGVVGSIAWNSKARTAYGWELVEALPLVPPRVRAVVVGDGDGVPHLRARAAELGVADRLLTPGSVAHELVPDVLAGLDAVTWTQTPDAVGRCRTTMKLPEYLACGKYVLASDVGEARRCVTGNGRRIPYAGGRDPGYVAGIAAAIGDLAADSSLLARGRFGVDLARRFDWKRIGAGFAGVVREAVARTS